MGSVLVVEIMWVFNETVVEREVVSDGVPLLLKRISVIREVVSDVLVDLCESHLTPRRACNGYGDESDVGIG